MRSKTPRIAIAAAIVGMMLIGSVIWRNWAIIVDAVTDEGGNVFDAFGDLPWWAHTLLGAALVIQIAYRSGTLSALICKGALGFVIGLCAALMADTEWEWGAILIIVTLLVAYVWDIKRLIEGKFNPRVPEHRR